MNSAQHHWSKHPLTNSVVTAILGSGILAAVVAVFGARLQADLARRDKQREEFMRDADYLDKTMDQYDNWLAQYRRFHSIRLELEAAKGGKAAPSGMSSDALQKEYADARSKLAEVPNSDHIRKRLDARFGRVCSLAQPFAALKELEWKIATCNQYDQMQVYDLEAVDQMLNLEVLIYEAIQRRV